MHGNGTEVWKDGHTYVGQFKNGQKQGEGTMTYPNKFKQYKGPWHKNQRHGKGIEISLKANTQRVGEWKKDKWIRWISATQKVEQTTG